MTEVGPTELEKEMNVLSPDKKKIYLQIEHQERELDAKLLFSMFAAERGYETVLGYKGALREKHSTFPPGAWIHHNVRGRGRTLEYFWYRRLGFDVIALDEEALVRQTDNLFLRKHEPGVFRHVARVFAWGKSDRDFWLRSGMVSADKVAITGNPRTDLLKPELLNYYGNKVSEIKDRIGRYVLINTNFPTVNNAMGEFNKFNISDRRDYEATKAEVNGFLAHKKSIFEHFVDLIPKLAAAIHPDILVVRPHPSEDRSVWDERAKGIDNIKVVLEGSVVPWIIGAEAVVHNNCTTAVEAALLQKPVASYMPVTSDSFDNPFCNSMGRICSDESQLFSFVSQILKCEDPENYSRDKILLGFVKNDREKFSCEHMLEEIDKLAMNGPSSKRASSAEILVRNMIVRTAKYFRQLRKNRNEKLLAARKSDVRSVYIRRKTSELEPDEITSRMASFRSCLNRFHDVDCVSIAQDLYVIRK